MATARAQDWRALPERPRAPGGQHGREGRAVSIPSADGNTGPEDDRSVWPGVFAVVYTYNRKELVAHCLASILGQTVRPERIILIDNGSRDGTRDHLAAQGILDDPRVTFVRVEQNRGAAGGLREGFTQAYRRGCAWVWVMDDDVVCEPDTLERLRDAYEGAFGDPDRIGFLVSRLVTPDGRANNVPQVDERRPTVDSCAEWAEFLDRGLVKVRIAALTSMLLPRATLARHGTPSGDFFMWGEDTEYTLRVTQWRPGYLVGASRALHLRGVSGDLDIFNETDPRRISNFRYLYRNTTYLRRIYWPSHGFYLFLGKAALHFCRALAQRKYRLRRAAAILGGTLAGFTFRPRPVLLEGEPPPRPEVAAEVSPATGG